MHPGLSRCATGFLILIFSLSSPIRALTAPPSAATLPFDTPLDGVKGPYTSTVLELIRLHGAARSLVGHQGDYPVSMQCLQIKSSDSYFGAGQAMEIAAPIDQVEKVISDVDHYTELFSGFQDIHIEKKEGNKWLTFWEQRIPIFFLPNNKYEMWYLVDHSWPGMVIYRYQLKAPDKLLSSDGFILLEAQGKIATRYLEFDFWDARYGLLGSIAPQRIRQQSVEGLYRSDLGFKLKAEHPDWTYSKIRDETKDSYQGYPTAQILKECRALPRIFAKD